MHPTTNISCKLRVERMLYPRYGFNPGDFAILSCSVLDVIDGDPYDNDRITIKGKVFSADINAVYQFKGTLLQDDKYGYSYKIDFFQQNFDMSGEQEQLNYISTLVTDRQFMLITEALPNPYQVISSGDVIKLSSVKGIGKKTAQMIIDRFNSRIQFAKVYTHLYQYGLTIDAINTLLTKYDDADQLLDRIENNPYLLITEVRGIGWSKADALAAKVGIVGSDPRRIKGYIVHFFNNRAEEGHTWCTAQQLWDSLSYDLQIDDMAILRNALVALHDEAQLYWIEDRSKIGLSYLYKLEKNIANELKRIADGELIPCHNSDAEIRAIEQEQGWSFTDEQISAVHMLAENNVNIITGAAGTGKSTAVSAILKMLSGKRVGQCALSGRAAARLTEVTGQSGMTIHRLLGYEHGEFVYNQYNPIPYDIIILDEISMVGAELFYDLIKAIPTGAKLIMIGDDGQLQSIGLCNIFKDMLDSGVIPVARLTKIHRQAAKSAIITESIRVRNGVQLCEADWVGEDIRGELQDLKMQVYTDAILTRENILDQYRALLEQGVSKHQIQIVLPMKNRGEACTLNINKDVQEIVNSINADTEISIGAKNEYGLRLGDRVICTKNMYKAERPPELVKDGEKAECPVFNGDRGVITEIDARHMVIVFDQWGSIYINRDNFHNIELGYALSCHKLQGSEADYVIIGFDMSSRVLLTKEWLYTAITRAKKNCVLTCQSKALSYCIDTTNIPYKRTFLKDLLINRWQGLEEPDDQPPF